MRCSKCTKSFKQHTGKSWNDNMCNRCWLKLDTKIIKEIDFRNTKMFSTPFDQYLDLYTFSEIKNLPN